MIESFFSGINPLNMTPPTSVARPRSFCGDGFCDDFREVRQIEQAVDDVVRPVHPTIESKQREMTMLKNQIELADTRIKTCAFESALATPILQGSQEVRGNLGAGWSTFPLHSKPFFLL